MKNDFEDVSLSDGLAYMVPRKEFDRYLEQADSLKPDARGDKEKREVSRGFVWNTTHEDFNVA